MKFRQFVERQVYMHVAEYRSLYVFLAVLFFYRHYFWRCCC
ncbi:hypothetical protein [Geomicrobium sp. JCM 19055]